MLHDSGGPIRRWPTESGPFHPKLIVGGKRVVGEGEMVDPACAYLGSANVTGRGLETNLEVTMTSLDEAVAEASAAVFKELWTESVPVTSDWLQAYDVSYARAQRERSVGEVISVTDDADPETVPVSPSAARVVWVGLQSFTGDYRFQVEFPSRVANAMSSILGTASGRVGIQCQDGVMREMQYAYYEDNGMFRLNVPNDVPNVDWAREHHDGALRISLSEGGTVYAEIVRGAEYENLIERSRAMGTLGSTSTNRGARFNGWF